MLCRFRPGAEKKAKLMDVLVYLRRNSFLCKLQGWLLPGEWEQWLCPLPPQYCDPSVGGEVRHDGWVWDCWRWWSLVWLFLCQCTVCFFSLLPVSRFQCIVHLTLGTFVIFGRCHIDLGLWMTLWKTEACRKGCDSCKIISHHTHPGWWFWCFQTQTSVGKGSRGCWGHGRHWDIGAVMGYEGCNMTYMDYVNISTHIFQCNIPGFGVFCNAVCDENASLDLAEMW